MGNLKKSFLTKALSSRQLKILADAMFLREYKAKDIICKFGDIGKEYFILKEGEIQVFVYEDGVKPNDPDLSKKILREKTLPAGVGFGELALMYGDKRTATV